ncbi:PaaI family thioesterase [Nocardia veterana]|uniref:PaaI family thioesterase n=1 Tax=Nocardia veterana TaxID=132249 RepID=A0A7X6M310_9NOCA|nr:PaaI family thioesterase [Nocardia veterana]NKY88814.1 PaaI family thioesterase [Nocardia veterana]
MTVGSEAGSAIDTTDGTRTLRLQWEDPSVAVLGLVQLTRDELVERLRAGDLPLPPLAKLLNVAVADADPGRMTLLLTPDERHINFLGVVGGGVAGAVLDVAMWGAVQLSVDDKSMITTVSMNTNLIRGIAHNQGPLRAIGEAVHVGRTTATAQARLVDAGDRLYATATATFVRMGAGRS